MVNIWAVLIASVLAMVLGALWYGPLFGRQWLKIVGATAQTMAERQAMQRRAGPLYVVQFFLGVLQVWVLAYFIALWEDSSALMYAFLVWLGIVMPVIAAASMWNNDSAKVSWARFLIQSGYQLLVFLMFGVILGLM